MFSLSLYRHPFIYTLFTSLFTLIINNKNEGIYNMLDWSSTSLRPPSFEGCHPTGFLPVQNIMCVRNFSINVFLLQKHNSNTLIPKFLTHSWKREIINTPMVGTRLVSIHSHLKRWPPTDDGGLRDFYHDWTNSILQNWKLNFGEYWPYSWVPDPKIYWNCESSVIRWWFSLWLPVINKSHHRLGKLI